MPALPPSTQGTRGGPTRKSAKGGWTPEQVLLAFLLPGLAWQVVDIDVKLLCRVTQDELLRRAVHHHGGRNWKQVGKPLARLRRFGIKSVAATILLLKLLLAQGLATLEAGLVTACATHAAEYFEDRTDVQCLHRWQKVLNPELVKGPWTKEVRQLGGFCNLCDQCQHFLSCRKMTRLPALWAN